MKIEHIKTLIQSGNINFLFGSGLSYPYLSTLSDIEKLLTLLREDRDISKKAYNFLKALIYGKYFNAVIAPNLDIDRFLSSEGKFTEKKRCLNCQEVINNYKDFLTIWNEIINKRANRLLSVIGNFACTTFGNAECTKIGKIKSRKKR